MYEFEFEFDLKLDDRVRVRVSTLSFWVIVSVSSLEYPFWGSVFGSFSGPFGDPFSVPLGTDFQVHLGTHLGTEKDHFEQLVNYQHSVRDSSLKCRFTTALNHSPISLTLPLSSFGWLRNNSSSMNLRIELP